MNAKAPTFHAAPGKPQSRSVILNTRPRRRAALSLAPLIDVTFILLIFFMLVTQFQRTAAVDVSIAPETVTPIIESGPADDAGLALRVTLQPNGMATLSGAPDVFPVKQLPERLTSAFPGKMPLVHIKPEQGVSVQALVDVVGLLQQMSSVKFQVLTSSYGGQK